MFVLPPGICKNKYNSFSGIMDEIIFEICIDTIPFEVKAISPLSGSLPYLLPQPDSLLLIITPLHTPSTISVPPIGQLFYPPFSEKAQSSKVPERRFSNVLYGQP